MGLSILDSAMNPQAIGTCRDYSVSLAYSYTFPNSLPTSNFKSHFIPQNLTFRKSKTTFSATRPTRSLVICSAERTSPAKALRLILGSPGFSISAARLALPDTGFISYGEMVDQGQLITQAVSIPIIGDGDNGYGNAMNVKRTVKGYIKAGFAGIILEDQDALTAIKGGRIPPPGSMPTFEGIKEILGFNSYYEEEKRYAISTSQMLRPGGYTSASSNVYGIQRRSPDDTQQRSQSPQDPVVEVITPDVYNNYGADGLRDPFSGIWSRTLRIKITGRDGFEKLDVRIPAGFLEGITNIVPALGGVNIKELLDDAAGEVGGKLLLDFNDTMGDRIQVLLE
ncbi:hypothetical protein GH714_009285 [Hevea brasiliensis]|uniref:Isocitrate lyase n=1 Tax=Hevea brasiliensis TaxID=3981 RepID=A0A6A6LJA9_HEVBR|nr:hypothetical protein GH714_009285 [Hevea brasiliensis]